MNNKTIAIVSYITIIGWAIAYFSYKDANPKSSLVRYHLSQSLGLAIINILFAIAFFIIAGIIPALSFLSIVALVFVILWVIGIINANNEQEKPLPVIGKMFENKFSFIQ